MRLTNRATSVAALAVLLTLAACAGKPAKPPASAGGKPAVSAGSKVKIGKPYEVKMIQRDDLQRGHDRPHALGEHGQ